MDGVIANPFEEINQRVKSEGVVPIPWENWTDYNTHNIYPAIPKKVVKSWYRNPIVMRNAIPFMETLNWMKHIN